MYYYILILNMIFVLLFLVLVIWCSKQYINNKEKNIPFECGFDPYFISRCFFSMRFFKLGLIFLLFDVEIIVIMPMPLFLDLNKMLLICILFLGVLIFLGLFIEWYQKTIFWL